MEKALGKFSLGVGDRFGCQAEAQLEACIRAIKDGIEVTPVWNKSNREHDIIGSDPSETRKAADTAVTKLGWKKHYFLDADHVNAGTVVRFIPHCDFFTLDVADSIGIPAGLEFVEDFVQRHKELVGNIEIPGIAGELHVSPAELERIARKYLLAVQQARQIYCQIASVKGEGNFITEVSMDETDAPQTPTELLVILAALGDERIPAQTIAPKFTGRFNKGVDYVGNLHQFEREFNDDLAIIKHAVDCYGLHSDLKLSVHSGSDKFSIYPLMRNALARTGAGLHLKTAGTTWLEEVIGIAEAGGDGLAMAKEIYIKSLEHIDDLSAPYSTVVDIAKSSLPSAYEVSQWNASQFVGALRHDPHAIAYNPNFRQLIHIGYKVAGQMGAAYVDAVKAYRDFVSKNVTQNLYERHLKPLFIGLGR